eukprot:s1642_g5.t1
MEVKFATSGATAVQLTRDEFQLQTGKELQQAIARKLHVSAHTLRLLDKHAAIAADHVFSNDAAVLDVVLMPYEPWSAESSRAVGCALSSNGVEGCEHMVLGQESNDAAALDVVLMPYEPWSAESSRAVGNAARSNDVAALERLLDVPVDPNHSDDFGCAPLRLASSHGRLESAVMLLDAKASIDQVDREAGDCRQVACVGTHAYRLLDKHAVIAADHVFTGDAAVLDVVLMPYEPWTVLAAQPLRLASSHGRLESAVMLLDAKASIDQVDRAGCTALGAAAERGRVAMVSLLLARRAACGAMASDGEAPLLAAAREGHIEIVSLLLAHGADVDQCHPGRDTALQVATRYGHLPVLTALLDASASTSQCDVTGETCLSVAAKAGNVDVARLLVDGGACPDAGPSRGDPPLLAAARRGHLSFVRFLVSARASINLRNVDGCSALQLAFENHHDDVVDFFLDSGAFATARVLQRIEREAEISQWSAETQRWSAETQRVIAAACCDPSLWTDLDKVVQKHRYSLTSIASWPLDVCVVAQPTDRASLLLGSLRAAASLDVIGRSHGIVVNIVVTLCNHKHMNVRGAPSDWQGYFAANDVFHVQCPMEDCIVSSKDTARRRALRQRCLQCLKSVCSQLWHHSMLAVSHDMPMHVLSLLQRRQSQLCDVVRMAHCCI